MSYMGRDASRHARYAKTEKGRATRAKAAKKWAAANRDKINAWKRERAATQMELLRQIKIARGCIDCGYRAAAEALDFDHVGQEPKKFNVCEARGRYSTEVLLEEVAKCVVRCANCHRIKTHRERDFCKRAA